MKVPFKRAIEGALLGPRRKRLLGVILSTLAYGVALPDQCLAQGGTSFVRSGSFEIGGFVGATYGVDQVRALGGGNVTFAVSKWLLPYVEYSYFPGIPRTVSQALPGLPGVVGSSSAPIPLSDFHGGVHIRIPIRESNIVPYLVFGVGGLTHFQHTATLTYTGADGLSHTLSATEPGGTDFAVNFGGGIRYYLNQRLGFRLEAKAYRPSNTAITPIFGKVEFGVFYQLR
jgi:hypothetical protein